jgi:hypothetical protein
VQSVFEVTAVIDVHAPHEPVLNWRDFFIHLATITIGLLIALSLEGCVERQHHRHLVHDAEASLQAEIKNNEKEMADTLSRLHEEQAALKRDIVAIRYIRVHKSSQGQSINLSFAIHRFQDVGWKTTQSTGAFSYMPYGLAEEYSDIYGAQGELDASEQQAAQDITVALAPLLNQDDRWELTPAECDTIEARIEMLQAQLLLVDTFMKDVDGDYKTFLAAHRG